MKKSLFLPITLMAFSVVAKAQNTVWPGTLDNLPVGIGTTTPRTRLEVAPPSNNTAVSAGIFHSSGHQAWGHVLSLITDDVNGDDPRLLFSYRAGSKTWSLGGYSNAMRFSLWEDSGDGLFGQGFGTERFTVLPGGKVGIGTATPDEFLTIGGEDGTNSNSRRAIRLGAGGFSEPGGAYQSSNGDKIVLYDALSASYDARIGVGTHGNFWMKSLTPSGISNFEWYSGNAVTTPKMVLSGDGNLSIGTTDSHVLNSL
jgi:hypothetical protein